MPLAQLRLLVKNVPASNVVVCTAFDEEGGFICDADHSCSYRAIHRCLDKLPALIEHGSYDIRIEVMNPVDDDSGEGL